MQEFTMKMVDQHKGILTGLGLLYLLRWTFWIGSHLFDGIRAFLLPRILNTDFPKRFGPWALVTGCTRGIGQEYAFALASRGLKVVLVSRGKERLQQVAKEIEEQYKVETKVIVVDFTREGAVSQIVEEVKKAGIEVGLLVNNVGTVGDHMFGSFLETSEQAVKDIIRVNISTATGLCHALIPAMVERGRGAVVNIVSIMSFQPMPYCTLYAASKHFMRAFTLSLTEELSGSGVVVQEVDPGHVATDMTVHVVPATPVPYPKTFVTSAVSTLGHTSQTCGWWGHSLHHVISVLLVPQSWLVPLMGWMGRQNINHRLAKESKQQ